MKEKDFSFDFKSDNVFRDLIGVKGLESDVYLYFFLSVWEWPWAYEREFNLSSGANQEGCHNAKDGKNLSAVLLSVTEDWFQRVAQILKAG